MLPVENFRSKEETRAKERRSSLFFPFSTKSGIFGFLEPVQLDYGKIL
jgi:hypothetical protein